MSLPAERSTRAPAKGARQLRAAETRDRIFVAAAELFSQGGYRLTTVDQIAARAGVAKGTFFVHFRSKDAVIAELVRFQTRAARKARERALKAGGPIDALRAAVMTLGELGAVSRALSRGVLTAVLESSELGGASTELFEAVLRDMLEDAHEAKRAGLLVGGVAPETIARSLLVAYLGAVLHYASSPKSTPLVSLLAPVVDAHLAAWTIAPRQKRRRASARPPAAPS
jgi:AcrR family transcriptional regulator